MKEKAIEFFGKNQLIWGIIAIVVHLLLHGPFMHWANRVEPLIGGIPFLPVYLWTVYAALFLVYFIGGMIIDKDMAAEE